jgi:hypothetical protein
VVEQSLRSYSLGAGPDARIGAVAFIQSILFLCTTLMSLIEEAQNWRAAGANPGATIPDDRV